MNPALLSPQRSPSYVVVGRYAIFDEIAAGGMATVHLGRLIGAGGFSRVVARVAVAPPVAGPAPLPVVATAGLTGPIRRLITYCWAIVQVLVVTQ